MQCDSCHGGNAEQMFWLRAVGGKVFLVPLCGTCEKIVRDAGRVLEMQKMVTSNYAAVARA